MDGWMRRLDFASPQSSGAVNGGGLVVFLVRAVCSKDEPSRFPDARENESDVHLDTYCNST